MRSLSVNAGSFIIASIVVLVLSFALMQTGTLGDEPAGIALNPEATPAVLDANATPAPTPGQLPIR
jgi:hypothetical protein